jgi:hypothetical protein
MVLNTDNFSYMQTITFLSVKDVVNAIVILPIVWEILLYPVA